MLFRSKQITVRQALQAFTEALGVRTVPHGLRKNAVGALLDAGCPYSEVQAITDQSMQMIEHYDAKNNRKARADAAIIKLDRARRNTG